LISAKTDARNVAISFKTPESRTRERLICRNGRGDDHEQSFQKISSELRFNRAFRRRQTKRSAFRFAHLRRQFITLHEKFIDKKLGSLPDTKKVENALAHAFGLTLKD
jgi:hypothetical protein